MRTEPTANPSPTDLTASSGFDWDAIFASLDSAAADAARVDRAIRGITDDELAAGFSALANLRRGAEPNYEERGLGTAYLLYYLAKRAANFAIGASAIELPLGTVRVLDIGAGTNAATLSLGICLPSRQFEIWAVEPSAEMAAAGNTAVRSLPNATVHPVAATLDDVLQQRVLELQEFDLVCMSAMLPYGWEIPAKTDRVELGEAFLLRVAPGGTLLVVEPGAKVRELAKFERCLDHTCMSCRIASGDELSSVVLWDRDLEQTSSVLREWYPGMRRSGKLSAEAEDLAGRPFPLGLGGRTTDQFLIASRTIGPAAPGDAPKMLARPTRPASVATPRQERTRLPRQLRARDWLLGSVIAAAAVAGCIIALTAFT